MSSAIDLPFSTVDVSVSGVLWAGAVALTTWIVARYAGRAVLRLGRDVNGIQEDLALRAARLIRYLVVILGVGVGLACLGAPVQPVLAAVILVAAAIFLMARGIADNFGAGLVMQARHTIRLGDVIESSGYVGHVTDLNSRAVVLETFDGRRVHLPNKQLMDGPLVNASVRGRTRSEIQVRVRLGDDDEPLALAAELEHAVTGVRGVFTTPAPHALLTAVEPHRATLVLRVWHDPGAGRQVSSRVTGCLHDRLTADGRRGAVVWPVPDPPLPPPPEV